MTNDSSGHFHLSGSASGELRKLRAVLRVGAHPTLSFSQLVELLVSHFRERQPDSRWVLDFEFSTRVGRPRGQHG